MFLFLYQGGIPFVILMSGPLPDNISSGMAEFGEVGTAALMKLNPFNLYGLVPGNYKSCMIKVNNF